MVRECLAHCALEGSVRGPLLRGYREHHRKLNLAISVAKLAEKKVASPTRFGHQKGR